MNFRNIKRTACNFLYYAGLTPFYIAKSGYKTTCNAAAYRPFGHDEAFSMIDASRVILQNEYPEAFAAFNNCKLMKDIHSMGGSYDYKERTAYVMIVFATSKTIPPQIQCLDRVKFSYQFKEQAHFAVFRVFELEEYAKYSMQPLNSFEKIRAWWNKAS